MGGARFLRMAGGAGFLGYLAAVRLVAVRARLVTRGCRAVLLLVAAATHGRLRAGVRFVAPGAALVPGVDGGLLAHVARRASERRLFGTVGQTAMTVRAGFVSGVRGYLLDALLVAARAETEILERESEAMRLVAARAGNALVRCVVGTRELVARATGLGVHFGEHPVRVRIVAANASARGLPGMIGVDVLVTVGAGCLR